MLVYWSMFALPAMFAMTSRSGAMRQNIAQTLGLFLIFVAFVLLVGLRFEVGADWFNYAFITELISLETFGGSLDLSDPAFAAVTWISVQWGIETYGPSFVSGLLLMIGVTRFCQKQPDSWLALVAAVPYLVIVVGMGYVRQGAAIGLLLIALIHFERGALIRAGAWLLFAATFHVSALIIAPLGAMAVYRRRPLMLVPVVIGGIGVGYMLLRERVDRFVELYTENEFDSSGTMVRLVMNVLPAILFLVYRRRFPLTDQGRAFWVLVAAASLLLLPAILATPSTTILDRIGLYFIPIQLLVFGHLATIMSSTSIGRTSIVAIVVTYYAAVLFVWLNFATHAAAWLPYQFLGYEIG